MIKKGIYRHYKGALYEVLGVVKHSETLEYLVLYTPLCQANGESLWVRPIEMFKEQLVVDNRLTQRFKLIEAK